MRLLPARLHARTACGVLADQGKSRYGFWEGFHLASSADAGAGFAKVGTSRRGYQPCRYWRLKNSLAAGTFVTRMFALSYSIFLPALSDTTPSSIVSVSFEA